MSIPIWRGDAAPRAQVSHVTPVSVEIGDTFTLTINRKDVEITATDTTVATTVTLMAAAVEASTLAEFQELTASAGVNDDTEVTHLVLTGPDDGKPFTVTSSTGDAGNLAVSVEESQAGSAGQNEQQRVSLPGAATGGTFTLTFEGDECGTIAYDATGADVKTAMVAGITAFENADLTVTGDAEGPWLVEFTGAYANNNVSLLTGDGANVTKAASAYPVVVTTAVSGDAGINEKQYITLPGNPSGGTFTLTYDGDECGNINWNDDGDAVKTAMVAGITVFTANDLTVTGPVGGPYVVEFIGDFANADVALLVGDGSSLTGLATVQVDTTTSGSSSANEVQRLRFIGVSNVQFQFISHKNTLGTSSYFAYQGGFDESTSIQSALEIAFSIGTGNINVTKVSAAEAPGGGSYDVEFIGDLGGIDQSLLTVIVGSVDVSEIHAGGTLPVDEIQVVTLAGNPTGGTFTLTFRGQTTGTIIANAANTVVEAALETISTITVDDLTVTGDDGGPWTVTFGGTLAAEDVSEMTGDGSSLTGGVLSISSTPFTAEIDEVQIVTVYGDPAGGTFTLTFDAETTDALDFDATAAEVETALEGNVNIDAVTVVGSDGGPWTVTFHGDLGGTNVAQMTGTGTSLSGAAVAVSETQAAEAITDELQVITLDGSPSGGTFTLTFDSQTTAAIAYNAGSSVVQSAMEALSSIDVGEVLLSGAVGGPWTVLFQDALGGTDVDLITGDAGNLTSEGTQEFTTTLSIAPTGPNWFDDAENWTTGVVPVDGDTLVFEESSSDCLYGLAQSDITPAAIVRRSTFTGRVGLQLHNGSYYEYRDTYLELGNAADAQKITVTIGEGSGSGSGRFNLNTDDAETEIIVINTGIAEADVPAVLWKGTHASNIVRVFKGSFGAAVYANEVAVIAELQVGFKTDQDNDSEVVLGSDVTLGTVEKTGGTLSVGGISGTAIGTFEQFAGITTIDGSDGVGILEVNGGQLFYNSTGTIGGAPQVTGDGILDFSRDMRDKTVTNPIEIHGDVADVNDPFLMVANLRVDYNETTRLSNLGLNVRLTRSATS